MKKSDASISSLTLVGDIDNPMTLTEAEDKMAELISEDPSATYMVVPKLLDPSNSSLD